MDLRKPEHLEWDEVDEKWEDLTETFLAELQEALAKGIPLDFAAHCRDLKTWLPLEEPRQEYQWEVANRMLLCAEQANKHPKRDWNEIDRLSLALTDMPDMLKGHEDWAVDCVRLLLGYTPSAIQRLDIPVALSDQLTSEIGTLATLRLEIVPPRGGGAYHYPRRSLLTYPKPNFSKALSTAWIAANTLAQPQEAAKLVTVDPQTLFFWGLPDRKILGRSASAAAAKHVAGRWQILLSGLPAREIGGRSASAAAAFGWYHLLRGTKPDDGIIVLAQINRYGRLDRVGGVPAKVKAIVEDGRFDTIVVASTKNQRQAEKVLRKSNMHSQIRVVRHTNLESLISVRSWLVQEVLDYLDHLASRAAELPKYYPSHLRMSSEMGKTSFDDIRQMVQVVEDRSALDKYVAEERERSRAAGIDVDSLAYAPHRARPENETDNNQKPPPSPPVPWDSEAGERFKRAVILADPGFGKTWLLRYEARRLAREEAQHLRQGSKSLAEIILPIFVRLSDVNRDDMPLEESLLTIIGKKRSSAFRTFVCEKMENGFCAILLDAWDEVPIEIPQAGQSIAYRPHYRQRLGERLKAFATHFPTSRLLMTSRIVGYTNSPIPDAQELELIAFHSPQVEAFVRIWFNDHTLANHFMSMLGKNHTVRGLTGIPLMLTLACRAYQENQLTFPTRRVELYESCLRGLLRDWKEEKDEFGAPISDAEVDAQLELLQAISYPLFAEGYEQFSESLLRKKIIEWLKTVEPWHDLYIKPTILINNLKRDGILITAGEQRSAPLLFLHRTFHEYLAARALAHRANEEGWHTISDLIEQKAWLPGWQEVIILLAGQLDNPTSLLELLADKDQDDSFRNRLALATLCLPEIRNEQITIIDQITTDIFNLCWPHELHRTLDEMPHLVRALPALTQGSSRVCLPGTESKMALPDALISLLHDQNNDVRATAVRLIRKLGSGIATNTFLLGLLALLRHDNKQVRSSALEAVSALGEAAATDAFLSSLLALLCDDSEEVRSSAARAVWQLGEGAATDFFLEGFAALWPDDNEEVRSSAAHTGEAATDAILSDLLALLRHDNPYMRFFAVDAVSKLGEAAATDAFLQGLAALLSDDNEEVRFSAAHAVQRLGKAAATDDILKRVAAFLCDDNQYMRSLGVDTVRALREAAATDAFLECLAALLRDSDWRIRNFALEAVSAVGKAAATDKAILSALAALLRDDNQKVRFSAAGAVRALGEAAATDDILSSLAVLLYDPNQYMCFLAVSTVRVLGEAAATDAILSGLAALLRNYDEKLCSSALEAVLAVGEAAATDEAILERLAALLCNGNIKVRYATVRTVRALGDAAIDKIIAHLCYNNNEKERSSVTRAVIELGKPWPPRHLLPGILFRRWWEY